MGWTMSELFQLLFKIQSTPTSVIELPYIMSTCPPPSTESIPKVCTSIDASPPTNQRIFLVDQGGASFTATLYDSTSKPIGVIKSKKDKTLFDPVKLRDFHTRAGFAFMNQSDGTFNDFSTVHPSTYSVICAILSEAYKKSLDTLLHATATPAGTSITSLVRQTGKLRKRLHDPANVKEKALYEQAMKQALGPSFDFELLSSKDEALFEANAFFTMNGDTVNASVIGLGIGSSSTQFYSQLESGTIISGADPTLGVKASNTEKLSGKSVKAFEDQFTTLLTHAIRHSKQNMVVALNAIGYTIETLTSSAAEYADFQTKVQAATPVTSKEFLDVATSYHAKKESFGANLLLGFAQALLKFSCIHHVLFDRRGSNGKPLHYESSWAKYLVFQKSLSWDIHSLFGTFWGYLIILSYKFTPIFHIHVMWFSHKHSSILYIKKSLKK